MYRRESRRGDTVKLKKGSNTENLKTLYKTYYSHKPRVKTPPRMEMREFAFQLFDIDSYVRHLSFRSERELLSYLSEKAPRHAYYSVALYTFPDARSMEEKDWRGSELLFDIDSDNVPGCVSVKTGDDPLVDDSCLIAGFKLARRLSAMLKRDFDIDSVVYFTGNRGFHVLASCDYCLSLTREEREEIASYVAGEGLDLARVLYMTGRRRRVRGKLIVSPDDPGWRGWIGLEARERGVELASGDVSLAEVVLAEARIPIDKQVTRDPSRLSRIRGSLNGKASLLVTEVSGDSFTPDFTLSPFRGEVDVRATAEIPEVRLLGSAVSLKTGEEATLEAPLALLLASKGYAEILGGEVVVE